MALTFSRCSDSGPGDDAPFADRTVVPASVYPIAVDPAKVGKYPALAKSGGGQFYDDVLEYRVWFLDPEGGEDVYRAFASHEKAFEFYESNPTAEKPLVLVRQNVWVEETDDGEYVVESGERITEWRIESLLPEAKRGKDSIERFLEKNAAPPR